MPGDAWREFRSTPGFGIPPGPGQALFLFSEMALSVGNGDLQWVFEEMEICSGWFCAVTCAEPVPQRADGICPHPTHGVVLLLLWGLIPFSIFPFALSVPLG